MAEPARLSFGPSSSYGKYGLDGSRRVINAYAVKTEEGGKAPFTLYPAPGLRPFVTLPTKGYRGGIVVNQVAYVVYGRALYAVSLQGDVTVIGGIPGDGFVSCAANALADPHILFCAAGKVYLLRSGVFGELVNDVLPPIVDIDFIRGRFVFAAPDGRWWYSDINSVTIDGLNFYNAEGMPDGLTAIWVRRNEVWLLGTSSVEVYVPTENVDDPFNPMGGGALPYGCESSASVAQNNDSVFWIDQDHMVRRTSGYQPEDISPPWLTRLIEAEPDPSQIFGWAYAIDGQEFYEISGQNFTARYNLAGDASTGWTERETVGMSRWRGQGALEFYGDTLIGDCATGDLYKLDKDYPYDGDHKVLVRLQSAITHAWPMPLSIYSLHCDMLSSPIDDGSDPELANPEVMLRMSEDGGKSFDSVLKEPLGRHGEMSWVKFGPLGTWDRPGATAEISYWKAIGKAFMGAVINGHPGST